MDRSGDITGLAPICRLSATGKASTVVKSHLLSNHLPSFHLVHDRICGKLGLHVCCAVLCCAVSPLPKSRHQYYVCPRNREPCRLQSPYRTRMEGGPDVRASQHEQRGENRLEPAWINSEHDISFRDSRSKMPLSRASKPGSPFSAATK